MAPIAVALKCCVSVFMEREGLLCAKSGRLVEPC